MTVIVTRDVAPRFRGFLASCMLELVPGVYTTPTMTPAVRDRVWRVLSDWWDQLGGSCIVMTWTDRHLAGGQGLRILGAPPVELFDHDGLFLARKPALTPPPPSSNDTKPPT